MDGDLVCKCKKVYKTVKGYSTHILNCKEFLRCSCGKQYKTERGLKNHKMNCGTENEFKELERESSITPDYDGIIEDLERISIQPQKTCKNCNNLMGYNHLDLCLTKIGLIKIFICGECSLSFDNHEEHKKHVEIHK